MSTTDTTPAPVITRNGVSKTLVKSVFGKKSKNPGVEFYTPDFKLSDFDTDSKWAGFDFLTDLAYRAARKIFGEIHLDSINPETGLVDMDKWTQQAEDFTAGATTLDTLDEEIEELVSQQQIFALDDSFGEETEYGQGLAVKVKELAEKIKPLRAQKASIKAKYATIVAARDAKKAASAAKPEPVAA